MTLTVVHCFEPVDVEECQGQALPGPVRTLELAVYAIGRLVQRPALDEAQLETRAVG